MSEQEKIELNIIKAMLPGEKAEALQKIIDRHDKGWGDANKRLRKYECHHGYRLDESCISIQCDGINHTKEKL